VPALKGMCVRHYTCVPSSAKNSCFLGDSEFRSSVLAFDWLVIYQTENFVPISSLLRDRILSGGADCVYHRLNCCGYRLAKTGDHCHHGGMTSPPTGKHARTATAADHPVVPEPSFAERARTLMHLGRVGSLSTLSRKQSGFPFGSVMPYGLDERGRPIFLISTMAMHTQNLQQDARASLLVTQDASDGDPLGASRVTVIGTVRPVPKAEVAEVRRLYLLRYANSKYWVDFEDFSFYRMEVVDIYYVGGFGVMGWVATEDYSSSHADPLADSMVDIARHMNADHQDALVQLARTFAHIESQEATMIAVDRLGFQVRLKTAEGMRGARVAFPREVHSPEETRKVLIEMVQQARLQNQ